MARKWLKCVCKSLRPVCWYSMERKLKNFHCRCRRLRHHRKQRKSKLIRLSASLPPLLLNVSVKYFERKFPKKKIREKKKRNNCVNSSFDTQIAVKLAIVVRPQPAALVWWRRRPSTAIDNEIHFFLKYKFIFFFSFGHHSLDNRYQIETHLHRVTTIRAESISIFVYANNDTNARVEYGHWTSIIGCRKITNQKQNKKKWKWRGTRDVDKRNMFCAMCALVNQCNATGYNMKKKMEIKQYFVVLRWGKGQLAGRETTTEKQLLQQKQKTMKSFSTLVSIVRTDSGHNAIVLVAQMWL